MSGSPARSDRKVSHLSTENPAPVNPPLIGPRTDGATFFFPAAGAPASDKPEEENQPVAQSSLDVPAAQGATRGGRG